MEFRKLERKKTMTMNWDGLGDDDDEFYDPCNRISTAVRPNLCLDDDDNEDFDDCRVSFSARPSSVQTIQFAASTTMAAATPPMSPDYNIWMTSPESIKQRRQRLFQDMGLSADKAVLSFKHVDPNQVVNGQIPTTTSQVTAAVQSDTVHTDHKDSSKDDSSLSLPPLSFGGSRSEGEIDFLSIEKKRKEHLLGSTSKQRLTRTSSLIATPVAKSCPKKETAIKASPKASGPTCTKKQSDGRNLAPSSSKNNFDAAFFLIKNLDTGKEFVVNEYNQDGMWNKLSDIETGKQLTMEEFEKSVGYSSPVVKELMSREKAAANGRMMNQHGQDRKINSYLSKSLRVSKKRGAAVLKSIKGVANSMALRGEKEKEHLMVMDQTNAKNANNNNNNNNNRWVKVRQTGKSFKELSALHVCQEIQAHEGSIWTMKFSTDGRFLASAGEDSIINVWEVQECEVTSMKGKGSGGKKGNHVPNYVHVPDTVFSLSDRPVCSFKGHSDDVLDLSWSRSQQLLSSSMDKTVRLWDLETRSCLKLFAHNDYVTCIHFNPMDDDYFISGSLDAKLRIWDIPNRQVVDWTDVNEMVTAACYTPDGQGAIIGTHKGSCRLYSTNDCRLTQLEQVTVQNKKKVNPKKITGFQYCPIKPSELLVTTADSRIRVLDGSEVFYKFKGLKNTNSQIAASYTSDGTHVVSASEDSQVFVWRCEEPRNTSPGKRTVIIARGHEHFPCKDVSVAITWPGTLKNGPPPTGSVSHSKRHSILYESPPSKSDNNKKSLPLPPLPKKKNNSHVGNITTLPEEDSEIADLPSTMSRSATVPSATSSNSSAQSRNSGTMKYGDSLSKSTSALSSWTWVDSGHGHHAAAWGLTIVTATLGGEIKIYQNFGLPRRVTNIFV